jgi:hypothetical protein
MPVKICMLPNLERHECQKGLSLLKRRDDEASNLNQTNNAVDAKKQNSRVEVSRHAPKT